MAHYAGSFEEGYQPFSFTQPVVNDGNSGPLQDSVNPVQNKEQPTDSLSELWRLAQTNPEYMETYLQLLAERENTTNAQDWYERMSNSSYQRAVKDLEKAGLNPALALSGLNGAGSGSVQIPSTWSTSPYANKVSKQQADASSKSSDANMIKALLGIGTISVALLAALI